MTASRPSPAAPLLPPATRAAPVDWRLLVRRALAPLGFAPTPSADAALEALALQSAGEGESEGESVSAASAASADRCAALLLSLHAATAAWPFAVRAALRPPPVRLRGAEIAVGGAAMEAFVVLYNAAVAHFNAALERMSRMRTDDTATARATRNANGKAAYKSFGDAAKCAAQAAALAEESGGGDAPVLSPVDCTAVQRHFDLDAMRSLIDLCRAVAKYVFSTTSGAVSTRHSALAYLAYGIVSLPQPPGAHAESLRHLPTLLLAACHKHRAQFFYQELSNRAAEPEMERVLGHITYAYKLLDDLQREVVEEAASARSQRRSDNNKNNNSSGGWGILGRLSATLTGKGNGGNDANSSDSSTAADGEEAPFAQLVRLFAGSDLVRVFPLLTILAREVAQLTEKYAYENETVYMVRAMREDDVVADVPDVDPPERAAAPVFSPVRADAAATFAELPSAAELRARADRAGALRELSAELTALLDEPPPPAARASAQRLAALLRGRAGPLFCSIRDAIAEAAAALCASAENRRRGETKRAAAARALRQNRRAAALRQKGDAAAAALAALLPDATADALRAAMAPESFRLRRARRDVRAALERCGGGEAESEKAAALAAMRSARDAVADGHWERVARALEDAADAVTEARAVAEDTDADTKATRESTEGGERTESEEETESEECEESAKRVAPRGRRRCQSPEGVAETVKAAKGRGKQSNEGAVKAKERPRAAVQRQRGRDKAEVKPTVATVSNSLLRRIRELGSSSNEGSVANEDDDEEEEEDEEDEEDERDIEVIKGRKRGRPSPRRRRGL